MTSRMQLWGVLFLAAGVAFAQPPRRDGNGPPPPPPGPPRSVHDVLGGPPGKWWDNPDMVKKLNLSPDQQRKMDEIFQQSRLKLIDVNAALQKEEATLEPLVQVDQPDDSKVLPQLDRVAQARSELEKVDGRVLLALRHVLTPEQWRKLQEENPNRPPPPRR